MKWSFALLGVLLFGGFGMFVLIIFQDITVSNEQDYYLLKEVTEAAMIDAVDLAYYRATGEVKIVKEKFVENFTRRYAESTNFGTEDYTISFYDIWETPPKVSVKITNGTDTTLTVKNQKLEGDVVNKIDAILLTTSE